MSYIRSLSPSFILILAAAGLTVIFPQFLTPRMVFALQFAAIVVSSAGILLSIWFHRGRPLFASLTILVLVLVFHSPQMSQFSLLSDPAVFNLLRISIPLYIVLIALSPKRRIMDGTSLVWSFLLLLIAGLAWGIQNFEHVKLSLDLAHNLSFLPVPLSLLPVSDLSSILLILGFICVVISVPLHQTDKELSLAWISSYLALALALIQMESSGLALIWLAVAGTSIVIGLVQHAHNMAYIDELTTIPNRRALEEQLQRLRPKYSIAMVDIDHFKKFNDDHGHKIGDQALKKTAVHLQKVEGNGRIFRYGGEEFVIVFPGKGCKEAAAYCDSIRKQLEAEPFMKRSIRVLKSSSRRGSEKARNDGLIITVSIGVSESDNKSSKSGNPQQVLQNADKALYAAKKKGRNRVVIANINLQK